MPMFEPVYQGLNIVRITRDAVHRKIQKGKMDGKVIRTVLPFPLFMFSRKLVALTNVFRGHLHAWPECRCHLAVTR